MIIKIVQGLASLLKDPRNVQAFFSAIGASTVAASLFEDSACAQALPLLQSWRKQLVQHANTLPDDQNTNPFTGTDLSVTNWLIDHVDELIEKGQKFLTLSQKGKR